MKVAILRAVGDGGLQDPRTGVYVSSKRDTLIPYSDWAESLVNHKQLRVVEVLDGSNYAEYVNYLTEAKGDEEKALAAYRKALPSGKKGAEKIIPVEDAADAIRQREEMRTKKDGAPTVAKAAEAPAAKSE